MKKYELTTNNKNGLYQIRALIDIPRYDIKKGDLGGFIEKESNLSHEGNAWVSGNARVYGNAQVYGNALVYGNARVYGDAWVYGNARVSTGIIECNKDFIEFRLNSYPATAIKDGVQIGCQFKSYQEWLSLSDEDELVKNFEMTKEYKSFIQFAKEYFKNIENRGNL